MSNDSANLSSTHVTKGVMILIGLIVLFSLAPREFLGGKVIFDLEMRAEDYLGVLTHLAIIALIVERFVEIFTSVLRTPERVMKESALREAVDSGKDEDINVARKELGKYKAETGIFAITISFVAGLIVASVGIHVLSPLFDTSELASTQKRFFDAIDIVITAGLIAGGSKGVNALTSSIGAVFDAMKYQSRANEEKAKKGMSKK